jgi:hypothetical protein
MQMMSGLGVTLWFLLPIFAVVLLGYGALALTRRLAPQSTLAALGAGLVVPLCVAQFAVYLGAWSVSFGIGDAGKAAPLAIDALVAVLGVPLMYVLYLGPSALGFVRAWLPDDAYLLVGLAALNSVLWGFALAWLVTRMRKRAAT